MLRKMEEIIPGSAERIIAMAEREQTMRGDFQIRALEYDLRSTFFFRLVAVGLYATSVLLAAFVFIYSNSPYSLVFSIAILAIPVFPMIIMSLSGKSHSEKGR
ncbi:MAG: DUF2335 domain-containing protein [Pseudooceanicola sp.]|nr:DUF2335 domain-containing protein [Pseudooceanicola sp.]